MFGLGNGTDLLGDPAQKRILRRFELGMSGMFWLIEAPRLANWAFRIGINLVANSVMESCGAMEKFCFSICTQAKKNLSKGFKDPPPSSRPIVYAQLQQKMIEAGISTEVSETVIASEMLDQIQAGHEGTDITVTLLMCELVRHPNARMKLYAELSTLGKDKSSLQVIANLPYLDALIMETMRRYPGGLGPFPRYVPDAGAKLAGFDIPGGTTVSTSVYSLHRNTNVFPKPEEWLPERWIDAIIEEKKGNDQVVLGIRKWRTEVYWKPFCNSW